MTPTAPLDGFSASLTTAQNPALTSSAAMLATGHASLAILGTGDPPTAPAPINAAVPQNRSWQRQVSLPQRMLPAPPVPVQRSPDTAPPMTPDVAGAADPVEMAPTPSITVAEPAPGNTPLTRAPELGEYREVPVVVPQSTATGVTADHAPAEPARHGQPVRSAPPVQRLEGSATPTAIPDTSVQPPPVQRAETPVTLSGNASHRSADAGRNVVARSAPAPPLPSALRAITESEATGPSVIPAPVLDDPPPGRPVPAVTDLTDTAEAPAAAPPPLDVQRSAHSESITWFSPDDPVRLPPTAHPVAVGRPQAAAPAVAVQRVSPRPPTAQPAPAVPARECPPATTPLKPPPPAPPAVQVATAVVAQRVRRHEPTETAAVAAAQRISVKPVPEPTTPPPPPPAVEAPHIRTDAPTATEPKFAVQRVATPARPAPPVPLPSVGTPRAQQGSAVVRSVVPEVQRAVSPATPEPAVAPVPRRLVVLPPLRAPVHTVTPSPDMPTMQHIAESPAPVPLQRMFEHTAAPPGPRDRPSAATPFPLPPSVTQYDGYTEVSFDQHSVQRDADPSESPDPPDEPAVPQAPVTATPAASPAAIGGVPAAGGNIDELVNRLYDPLAARLRSELWLDRERAGVLMDLRR
ncbi:hypothetical protein [Mycolicibacterium monacense]|uniref:hypothetical protein n=1 Tax=Mycolicibacterium monacense TaxID=85693 RepID=UPI0007EBEE9A|nr:hypothetical protein [Mycolicibacterium monacense]OBB62095.1 hypothetical protein A6B34_26955 [Mycolicibacterium monacense]